MLEHSGRSCNQTHIMWLVCQRPRSTFVSYTYYVTRMSSKTVTYTAHSYVIIWRHCQIVQYLPWPLSTKSKLVTQTLFNGTLIKHPQETVGRLQAFCLIRKYEAIYTHKVCTCTTVTPLFTSKAKRDHYVQMTLSLRIAKQRGDSHKERRAVRSLPTLFKLQPTKRLHVKIGTGIPSLVELQRSNECWPNTVTPAQWQTNIAFLAHNFTV